MQHSVILPGRPSTWPQPWRDHYNERFAIMWAEGVKEPERKAEADIRRMADKQGDLFS